MVVGEQLKEAVVPGPKQATNAPFHLTSIPVTGERERSANHTTISAL